jgi:hypothetical protein
LSFTFPLFFLISPFVPEFDWGLYKKYTIQNLFCYSFLPHWFRVSLGKFFEKFLGKIFWGKFWGRIFLGEFEGKVKEIENKKTGILRNVP